MEKPWGWPGLAARFAESAENRLSVVGLYALLGALGVPAFYDKLLQVPLLNPI